MTSWVPSHLHTVCAFLLARHYVSHITLLKAYANQLNAHVDTFCHTCGEEIQLLERWFCRHPNAEAKRQQRAKRRAADEPGCVLALAGKTLP